MPQNFHETYPTLSILCFTSRYYIRPKRKRKQCLSIFFFFGGGGGGGGGGKQGVVGDVKNPNTLLLRHCNFLIKSQ